MDWLGGHLKWVLEAIANSDRGRKKKGAIEFPHPVKQLLHSSFRTGDKPGPPRKK